MSIDRAKEILGTDNIKEFSAEDTFNPGNTLSGVICYTPNNLYGRLVLFQVNDEPCEQIIYTTPKLHYPFDKNGKFHWPPVEKFEFWEKIDGTNVLAYHYSYKEKDFITFKTRLTPVMKDSALVSFREMWIEYRNENTWIDQVIEANPNYNLSFELYGSRNPITIKYDFPLEVALLFGVKRFNGNICPPSRLFRSGNVKTPGFMDGTQKDLTVIYNEMREACSVKNAVELRSEGFVMYAHVGEPSWRMLKCKGEEIEQIHWTASGSIPGLSIRNTAVNVFEDRDNPTVDDLIVLLKEEYSNELINKSMIKIGKAWDWAVELMALTKKVNEVWKIAKEQGFDVTKDKGATMRFISQYFEKKIMSRVGGIVLKQAGLL